MSETPTTYLCEDKMDSTFEVPQVATAAVYVKSTGIPEHMCKVEGLDYERPDLSLSHVINSFRTSGFQASNLWKVVNEVNRMLDAKERSEKEPLKSSEEDIRTPGKIWLSFTSNMISSGMREAFVFLAKNKYVDVIVTTAGGVEEDLIKCFAHTYVGEFRWKGADLRDRGWNRAGNLIIPNDNYCLFENWVQPILDTMLEEQKSSAGSEDPIIWTPSTMIDRLGKEINDESSLLYWCHKNQIPIFCPGLTDGSLGDNLYFHSYRNPGLNLDIIRDIRYINDIAVKTNMSGMIILGGGLPKHHTCNANLMRNGADYAVYISTAQEFDGCDSGAYPDEAVSWGKIRADAIPVKVFGDASILFPLVVAETFVKRHRQKEA